MFPPKFQKSSVRGLKDLVEPLIDKAHPKKSLKNIQQMPCYSMIDLITNINDMPKPKWKVIANHRLRSIPKSRKALCQLLQANEKPHRLYERDSNYEEDQQQKKQRLKEYKKAKIDLAQFLQMKDQYFPDIEHPIQKYNINPHWVIEKIAESQIQFPVVKKTWNLQSQCFKKLQECFVEQHERLKQLCRLYEPLWATIKKQPDTKQISDQVGKNVVLSIISKTIDFKPPENKWKKPSTANYTYNPILRQAAQDIYYFRQRLGYSSVKVLQQIRTSISLKQIIQQQRKLEQESINFAKIKSLSVNAQDKVNRQNQSNYFKQKPKDSKHFTKNSESQTKIQDQQENQGKINRKDIYSYIQYEKIHEYQVQHCPYDKNIKFPSLKHALAFLRKIMSNNNQISIDNYHFRTDQTEFIAYQATMEITQKINVMYLGDRIKFRCRKVHLLKTLQIHALRKIYAKLIALNADVIISQNDPRTISVPVPEVLKPVLLYFLFKCDVALSQILSKILAGQF